MTDRNVAAGHSHSADCYAGHTAAADCNHSADRTAVADCSRTEPVRRGM